MKRILIEIAQLIVLILAIGAPIYAMFFCHHAWLKFIVAGVTSGPCLWGGAKMLNWLDTKRKDI